MDGHGSNGHLVSNFVKEKVQEYFVDKKLYKKKKMTKSNSYIEIDNSGKIYQKLVHNNYEITRNFYKKVNDELYNTKFDIHFSGSTCVLVFKIGQKIICSNVGDSRAILVKNKITLNKSNLHDIEYDYVQLSYDHKPNNKEERERIEKLGGEVAQEYFIDKQDEPAGPFRVWNKGCNYPGIAISRSLGDKIAELIGVISEPDILEFDIDNNCKYIIMGSDGLFDHLSNDDIMRIAGPFLIENNPDKACFDVVEKAAQLFKEKENRIDDITINLIIL
jgi:serine/threonine protein phosphatase PrpC